MRRVGIAHAFLLAGFLALAGANAADDKKPDAKDAPKETTKAKGYLPQNWKELGLTDEQKQKVYKIQSKYGEDIDKLEAQIKELKAKIVAERLEVLNPEQQKKLESVLKAKAGGGK